MVPLGKAEGESENLRVGPIDGCAAGSVDVTIDGVLHVDVGVVGGPADGFVLIPDWQNFLRQQKISSFKIQG